MHRITSPRRGCRGTLRANIGPATGRQRDVNSCRKRYRSPRPPYDMYDASFTPVHPLYTLGSHLHSSPIAFILPFEQSCRMLHNVKGLAACEFIALLRSLRKTTDKSVREMQKVERKLGYQGINKLERTIGKESNRIFRTIICFRLATLLCRAGGDVLLHSLTSPTG